MCCVCCDPRRNIRMQTIVLQQCIDEKWRNNDTAEYVYTPCEREINAEVGQRRRNASLIELPGAPARPHKLVVLFSLRDTDLTSTDKRCTCKSSLFKILNLFETSRRGQQALEHSLSPCQNALSQVDVRRALAVATSPAAAAVVLSFRLLICQASELNECRLRRDQTRTPPHRDLTAQPP